MGFESGREGAGLRSVFAKGQAGDGFAWDDFFARIADGRFG
jgi:hypothetical protein